MMQNNGKKQKIRWDRLALLFVALSILIVSPIWLYSVVFGQKEIPTSQTISSDPTPKVYATPERGGDGVYRIDNTIIVNKKYGLPREYAPSENKEAAEAVNQLIKAMQRERFSVSSEYVGYRSFEKQQALYETYTSENGKEQADTFSARPGFSEHQTGLAFDIVDGSGELLQSKNSPQATAWLQDNAHTYGFIIRYMKDKETITGYMHEEWHVRYLGSDLAKKVYESKQSLEEYYNIEGGNYM